MTCTLERLDGASHVGVCCHGGGSYEGYQTYSPVYEQEAGEVPLLHQKDGENAQDGEEHVQEEEVVEEECVNEEEELVEEAEEGEAVDGEVEVKGEGVLLEVASEGRVPWERIEVEAFEVLGGY